MKKRLMSAMLILMLTAFLAACGQSGGNELANVNGSSITQSEVDQYLPFFMGMMGASVSQATDALKEQALGDLVTMEVVKQSLQASGNILPASLDEDFENYEKELMADEANAKFLKDNRISTEFLKKLYTDQIYMEYFFEQILKPEVLSMEAEAKQYYEENKEEFLRVRASHILVDITDKELAEEILEKAKAGEDFAELAEAHSTDTVANASGGDLNFFKKGDMVKAFEDAVFSMEVNEIKGPVETEFGYHIVKLTDKKYLTFDETFAEDGDLYIDFFDKVYQEKMEEFKKNMKIEYK